MASAPRAGEKTEPRSLFDRLQDIDTRLLDFGAAIVLSAFGIVTVLTRTAGDGFRSDDLLGLALVLAQTAPLALRRMSPLGVLVVISVALVAHSALGYEVVQAGTSGSLVSLYGATASTDSRGSTAAAAITAAAIVGFFATNRGDYGLVDIAAISVTWAMAWFLGTYVKLERRVRTRTRELQTLLEMSRSVTSTLDLQQLYEVALDHLQELIPYTGAAIQHLTEDGPQQVATRRPLDAKPNRRAIPAWYQTNIWARLQRGEPVVIDDIRGDEPLAIEYREASGDLEEAGLDYFRSWMSVPLMVKDRSIGAIGIVHRESGFFTASQVSLAQNVANQVAIAIENARLFEESARRTRNLQALLEMSQAVASTLDLEALFEVALDKLKELIPYTGANLGLRIGSETVQVASRRPAGISRDPVKRAPNWEAVPLIQELLSGRTLVIPDVRGDDPQAVQFRATFAEDLALTNMRYFRALVTVPLIVKSKVIGDLSVSHEQPGFFQPEHVELAQSLANQVAVAIENARLFEESGRRAKELAALLELSRSIASTLDVQQLFEVAIERIRDVVPYTGGSIGLRLADGQLHSVVRRPRGDARPFGEASRS
jgi:GAF domain-containing protein